MITINDYRNPDICQTITAQYFKTSLANFSRGGQRYSKPGVIDCNADGNIAPSEIEEFLNEREQGNNSGR